MNRAKHRPAGQRGGKVPRSLRHVEIDATADPATLPLEVAPLVEPILTAYSRQFVARGVQGFSEQAKRTRFFSVQDDRICIPAGLIPRIKSHLETHGIRVRVANRRRLWPQLERVDRTLLHDATAEEGRVLTSLCDHSQGQLIVRDVEEQRSVIALAARLFAASRVLIVTANNSHQDKLCADLNRRLDRRVCKPGDVDWGAFHNVVVCNLSSISFWKEIDPYVVIFAGVDSAVAKLSRDVAKRMPRLLLTPALTYCVTVSPGRLDELTELRLEAVCGPVIYDARGRASVCVLMARSPHIPPPQAETSLERKRQAIWHSEPRNKRIARIARAVTRGQLGKLAQSGVLPVAGDGRLDQWSRDSVAILVESNEHARKLALVLPDWTLVTAVPDGDGLIEAPPLGPGRHIVTATMASEEGLLADVVIRASGGASPLVVKDFGDGKRADRERLLIDLADDFDLQSKDDTRHRIRDYQSRGWRFDATSKVEDAR